MTSLVIDVMASFFVAIKSPFYHCNQPAVSLQDSVAFCLHHMCLSSIDCCKVKFSVRPLLSPLTACWETIQQHAADWSDLKCTSRTLQGILILPGVLVTCAHLIRLPLSYIASIFQSLPFPFIHPHFERMTLYFSSSAAVWWKCPPFPTTFLHSCASLYACSLHFSPSQRMSSSSPFSTSSRVV